MVQNVLYLGMAFDIWSALQICPDLDTLFVLDLFDFSYGYHHKYGTNVTFDSTFQDIEPTIETLKHEVKSILLNGSDINSVDAYASSVSQVLHLKSKSIILEDVTLPDGTWILTFVYNGKKRVLKRYESDFQKIWPQDVTSLSWILGPGSVYFGPIEDPSEDFGTECAYTSPIFVKQLVDRSLPNAQVVVLYFNHQTWDQKIIIARRTDDKSFMELSVMSVEKVVNLCVNKEKKESMDNIKNQIDGGDRFTNALTGAAIGSLVSPRGQRGSGAITGALIGSFLGGSKRRRSPKSKSKLRRSKSVTRRGRNKSRYTESEMKKYASRKSPPFPANLNCGKIMKGNDGYLYESRKNVRGVCAWKKY